MDREALIRIHSPDSGLALRSAVVVGNRDKCAGFGELVSRVSKPAIHPILTCRDEQDAEGRLLAHHRKATLPVRRSRTARRFTTSPRTPAPRWYRSTKSKGPFRRQMTIWTISAQEGTGGDRVA